MFDYMFVALSRVIGMWVKWMFHFFSFFSFIHSLDNPYDCVYTMAVATCLAKNHSRLLVRSLFFPVRIVKSVCACVRYFCRFYSSASLIIFFSRIHLTHVMRARAHTKKSREERESERASERVRESKKRLWLGREKPKHRFFFLWFTLRSFIFLSLRSARVFVAYKNGRIIRHSNALE